MLGNGMIPLVSLCCVHSVVMPSTVSGEKGENANPLEYSKDFDLVCTTLYDDLFGI